MKTELFHPLFAHLPIGLLCIAPVFKIIAIVLSQFGQKILAERVNFSFRLNLYIALLGYLLVLFLGDMAADVVKSELSKLQDLYNHEEFAYYCLYAFMVATTLETFSMIETDHKISIYLKSIWLQFLILVFLFVGSFYLYKTGHLGSQLVYEQGAGVNLPKNCSN